MLKARLIRVGCATLVCQVKDSRPPMTTSPSPSAQAAQLRRQANDESGARQQYLLWLAAEWDKTAAREAQSKRRPAAGDLRSNLIRAD